eukprot:1690367-Alexandrium_andersonii.AAC.1
MGDPGDGGELHDQAAGFARDATVTLHNAAELIPNPVVWADFHVMLELQSSLADVERLMNTCPCHANDCVDLDGRRSGVGGR